MHYESCTWMAPSQWTGVEPENERPRNAAEVTSKLDKWYNSGKPFFSRESIRQIYEQLQRPVQSGDKVSVMGLDDVVVNFDNVSGETRPASPPHLEYLLQMPCIRYLSIEGMKRESEYVDLSSAYCPLRIGHQAISRNKLSGELESDSIAENYAAIESSFRRSLRAWEDSDACKQLRSTLSSVNDIPKITKVIGVACGPISLPDGESLFSRSAFQHALLFTIRDVLQPIDNGEISCYSQDPVYTAIDKSVLEESGIIVLEDPEAWLEIDELSVVFSCSPNIPVKQIVADLTRSAILIWGKVDERAPIEEIESVPIYRTSDCVLSPATESAGPTQARLA